ncbi:MAG TPA: GDSL-type esterase/lipase family protein [candidate division Zixibacteria bacterium]|nr:hypothetical protein [candidate division Zixibacteria bacterium]MDD4918168.1 GDSL-type esterase/lipase family protein [candidate division Zixibacteria bacterium]MDM7972776.1 GDSL-type esterase/lipase family protein [candidate division Zixibacteria bacterium]HOD67200.1 GDSL-type esterase/lipase family protein [candidate division Zixibacteria bacterium]HPI32259.1 GDSL-type esterase/lipase family protein [candidate division Zixibacteria bacterium]
MSRVLKLVLAASLVGNLAIVWVGYKAYQYRTHINYWLDKYTEVVEEFSGRSRYRQDNERLRSDTAVPGRVVFLGTQVISRWDVGRSFPRWEAIDRGVAGQRLAGMLLRFQPDVLDLGPEAVVIEISSYNFRPEWPVRELEDYAESMADLARARGVAPIIGSVIPPWDADLGLGDYAIRDSIAAFNEWLQQGMAEGRWQVADFHGALADGEGYLRRELAAESIDPNRAGYERMTAAVDSVLGRALGR